MTHPRALDEQPPRKLTGDHCRCAGCGEYFNSTNAFDLHRTGKGSDRRCLTVIEMRDRGMALNATNWWCGKLKTQAMSTDPLGEYRVA